MMNQEVDIFSFALGLDEHFRIIGLRVESSTLKPCLHIDIEYVKGTRFEMNGEEYSIYDHQERTWRHLDFFQYECYINCRVPRIRLKTGEIQLVSVPWSDSNRRFTLLFEQYVLQLTKEGLSASAVGRLLAIDPQRVYRIVKRYVVEALASTQLQPALHLSIDETSSKKGHNYLTILSDIEAKKVVGIGFGKDCQAAESAITEMEFRQLEIRSPKTISMDMSPSFIKAASKYLPQTQIIFDRFHISMHLNSAIDKIRRKEQKEHKELKYSRFLWLRNSKDIKHEHKETLKILASSFPTIGKAYELKEKFRQVWDNAKEDGRLKWLKAWLEEAWDSGIDELKQFVTMIDQHWYGIKTYFKTLRNNAFAERVNLKIQEIKRTAKGYRNMENFKYMIYFHLGDLNIITHYK